MNCHPERSGRFAKRSSRAVEGPLRVRHYHHQGQIRWKKNEVFLSEVLWGERIGLLPVDERWFTTYFAEFPLARFDARKLRVLPLPHEEDFYSAEARGRGRFPFPCPIPSLRRKKCQGCLRSKMSGMSPAVHQLQLAWCPRMPTALRLPQTNFQPHLLAGAGSFLDCPFGLNRLLTQPLRNLGQLPLVGTDRGQVLQLANQI